MAGFIVKSHEDNYPFPQESLDTINIKLLCILCYGWGEDYGISMLLFGRNCFNCIKRVVVY